MIDCYYFLFLSFWQYRKYDYAGVFLSHIFIIVSCYFAFLRFDIDLFAILWYNYTTKKKGASGYGYWRKNKITKKRIKYEC